MFTLAAVLGLSLGSGQGCHHDLRPFLVNAIEKAEMARVDQFLPMTGAMLYVQGYAAGFLDARTGPFR